MCGSAWLFCHKGKYYITHDFNEDLCDLSIDAAQVDELIAEPLKKLCNKGYITNYSCSGHPFSDCYYEVTDDPEKINRINEAEHIAVTPFEDNAVAICDMDEPQTDLKAFSKQKDSDKRNKI